MRILFGRLSLSVDARVRLGMCVGLSAAAARLKNRPVASASGRHLDWAPAVCAIIVDLWVVWCLVDRGEFSLENVVHWVGRGFVVTMVRLG